MELQLRALLTASSALGALVPPEGINWGVHPQGAPYPGVVLNLISNADGLTMQGPDGLWQGRVQVDCYGVTYASARGVADAIISTLSGYRGGQFRGIFMAAERAMHDTGASDRPFRISMDFMTNWRQ